MQCLVNLFQGNDPSTLPIQSALLNSVAWRWRAAFTVTYPLEFLCLSVSKLLILDRMVDFVELNDVGTRNKWHVGRRLGMLVVLVGSLAGFAANAAAAVRFGEAAGTFDASFAEYAGNNTDAGQDLSNQAKRQYQRAVSIASNQYICEVAVLLFIIASFVVAAAACARRIRVVLFSAHDGSDGTAMQSAVNQLRKQILGTVSVVFAAFLLRSCYSTLQASAYFQQNIGINCSPNFCDLCYNVHTHITFWLTRTPAIQLTTVRESHLP